MRIISSSLSFFQTATGIKFTVYQMLIFSLLIWGSGSAQTFTKITDSNNPIVSTTLESNYTGTAWVDYDGDGNLDLYTTKGFLFRNSGGGDFELIDTEIGDYQIGHLGNGGSWADYDNDGDPDIALAATPSMLFVNNSGQSFTGILDGDLGLGVDNTGWACAWGDYDNDGFVDLLIVNPAGFLPSSTPCHLLHNEGDGRLKKINGFEFTELLDAYTVGIFSDYDDDGDLDIFIGSGPAGSADEDNLYRNMLTESGVATFERIDTAPIATDLQDGQTWNWIDYDNDGDLDAYLTNYAGAPDRLYRNDGDDGFTSILDSPLIKQEASLANNWGDLDNDGDLDCIVTNESGSSTHYYRNEGDGTFSEQTNGLTTAGATRGATLGDYDNDGDLDVFISGPSKGLFRNDTDNGNHWLNITCTGTVSNHSAIGAKLFALANINGVDVWQRREISAQNSFNSHNSLRVHFGLGDASTVTLLRVEWPSGQVTELNNLAGDQFLQITEEIPEGFVRANFSADIVEIIDADELTVNFTETSFTDPNHPVIAWAWDFDNDGTVDSSDPAPQWTYTTADTYAVGLTVTTNLGTASLLREDYIRISGALAIIEFNESSANLGSIDHAIQQVDTSFYIYNIGAAADQISISLDLSNVDPPEAVSVAPLEFTLAGGDSQQISFSLFPPLLTPNGPFFTPKLIIDSQSGFGQTHFEKTVQFRIISVDAIDPDRTGIPYEFGLEQNHPNPFNPTTQIRYSLPQKSAVTLRIFDTVGRIVKTLVDGTEYPGFRIVGWDGRDDSGHQVASGIYFYRLEAGSFIQARKMMLVQ